MGLRKSWGARVLNRAQLRTMICEVEFCVNSRPLTCVRDKPDDPYVITPAHFLIPQPEIPSPITDPEFLQKGFLVKNELMDYFGELWCTECSRILPMGAGRTRGETAPLAVGSVVLLREEGSSRALWPLGLVERVYPGKDGHMRSVEVRTKKGIYTRSIQRLIQLEAVTAPPSLSGALSSIPEVHVFLVKALFRFALVTAA